MIARSPTGGASRRCSTSTSPLRLPAPLPARIGRPPLMRRLKLTVRVTASELRQAAVAIHRAPFANHLLRHRGTRSTRTLVDESLVAS